MAEIGGPIPPRPIKEKVCILIQGIHIINMPAVKLTREEKFGAIVIIVAFLVILYFLLIWYNSPYLLASDNP